MTEETKQAGADRRVLVVEDDATLREGLVEALTLRNWNVAWAVDGEDALSTFRAEPCDVVLTDIVMPGLDGLHLVERIREFDYETPIVILTGYATYDYSVRALRAGANDFVTKPFETKALVATLERALALSRTGSPAGPPGPGSRYAFETTLPCSFLASPAAEAALQEIAHRVDGLCRVAGYSRRRLAIHRAVEEALAHIHRQAVEEGRRGRRSDGSVGLDLSADRSSCVISIQGPPGMIRPERLEGDGGEDRAALLRSFCDRVTAAPDGSRLEMSFLRPGGGDA